MKIYQVDAFANNLFEGNPAAVVPLDTWLTDEQMANIAKENNLSETAFFVPKGEGYHIRWFTPGSEVKLCGHATLAAAHVLFNHLNYSSSKIEFDSLSGILIVEKEGDKLSLNFPSDLPTLVIPPDQLKDAFLTDPKNVYKGTSDYLLEFESEEEVLALTPKFNVLKGIRSRGFIATAPGKNYDFISRCFYPNVGIDEDPVTGSAHTTLTPFWAIKLNKDKLKAAQLSQRKGEIDCELHNDRVVLKGSAVTYLVGEIRNL